MCGCGDVGGKELKNAPAAASQKAPRQSGGRAGLTTLRVIHRINRCAEGQQHTPGQMESPEER